MISTWHEAAALALVLMAVAYLALCVWRAIRQRQRGACGACAACPAGSDEGSQKPLVSLELPADVTARRG